MLSSFLPSTLLARRTIYPSFNGAQTSISTEQAARLRVGAAGVAL